MLSLQYSKDRAIFPVVWIKETLKHREKMSTTEIPVAKRVQMLRKWMKEYDLSAFIVPTMDPHNSEYLPDHWKAREWLTGFTGSAGLAVVTAKEALLWTDSRYFLQAEEQLADTPFTLMREGMEGVPGVQEWLEEHFCEDGVIGYYGELMTDDMYEDLVNSEYLILQDVGEDPFDQIWKNRPALPKGKISIQPISAAGISVAEKLDMVREWMMNAKDVLTSFFLNDLSEIAWLLNLRGDDVDYNPFFVSYLLINEDDAVLFVDSEKISPEIASYLEENYITVRGYEEWADELHSLSEEEDGEPFLGMPKTMTSLVINKLDEIDLDYDLVDSPIGMLRAIKNNTEQAGFRQSMLNDGVAMVKFLRWLDENVEKGGVTEIGVDKKLTAFRAEQPGFCSLSFGTIAAYAEHGAIVHYEAEPETDVELQPKGLLLLDSGAHYEWGTTDITRTIALGELTEEERRVYTLVLKGHIGLARCRFPEGTTGLQLDTAARYAMWQEGYDFGHGTGHGVGSRLGVHEGPHQIRKNNRDCTLVPFHAGMTVTDEPGIYVAGRFGVRIENVLLAQKSVKTDFGNFLEFETLTLCPYDMRAVDFSMLTVAEKEWINAYHAKVRATLMPKLDDEADRQWLEAATKEI